MTDNKDLLSKLKRTTEALKKQNEDISTIGKLKAELKRKDSEIQQLKEALKEMYKAIEYGELELRTTYQRFTSYKGSSSLWNMQEMIRKYVYLIELKEPEK